MQAIAWESEFELNTSAGESRRMTAVHAQSAWQEVKARKVSRLAVIRSLPHKKERLAVATGLVAALV